MLMMLFCFVSGGVANATRIVHIMRVFHLASGLKINLHKSKLIGVGVAFEEVQGVAALIGCNAIQIPFVYLGVPVGGNMNRVASWKPMVDKFVSKLSTWKAKLLSIGGRLTLIKAVLGSAAIYYMSIYKVPVTVLKLLESIRARFFWGADLGERKMHWIAWNRILPSLDVGGLGIGSLGAFNNALLFKWKWRFLQHPDALWVRVVDAIHGSAASQRARNRTLTPWLNIDRAIGVLKEKGIDLIDNCSLNVGDGRKTRFWLDPWIASRPLAEEMPRFFSLETDPGVTVEYRNTVDKIKGAFLVEPRPGAPTTQWIHLQSLINNFEFREVPDCYVWELDTSGMFSVASARRHIDLVLLGDSGVPTRWNTLVPKKINILMWRLTRDRLPTRLNLRDKGIELPSLLCPGCGFTGESAAHLFAMCSEFTPLWNKVAVWWGVELPDVISIHSLVHWADHTRLNVHAKKAFDAVVAVVFWSIWNFRNNLIFGSAVPRKDELFDNIRSISYFWINNRRKVGRMCWNSWLVALHLISCTL